MWRPRRGEEYWAPVFNNEHVKSMKCVWMDDVLDVHNNTHGMVYKTREDADTCFDHMTRAAVSFRAALNP